MKKINISVTYDDYNTILTALMIEQERNQRVDNTPEQNKVLEQITKALEAVRDAL